ncbi:SDR family oxidoreductase [Halobacillus sp. A5]|uniref:SDR family oxidoreductase n=1 Tax=Halobacillus sp. A5 TaxID=2880263 RepID=UPI0020A62ED3|nr:SDR family oxidoreductase [Halobacillus sp. A5]MCP3029254.1 SDR family oxidoreductase [Halobacillus sp. A5]
MPNYMLTGFPGYLATNLIKEISNQGKPIDQLYLLYHPSVKDTAEYELDSLLKEGFLKENHVQLIQGDITLPHLGLTSERSASLLLKITHFFHLAALYDLAAPLLPSWRINVDGTRNVLEWLRHAAALEHFIYFSSAFVSGKREGKIFEHELSHTHGFKNHYEYTKYEAERLVQQYNSILPTTTLRPGIVVGHSQTGETMKFDGPYFILNLLHQLKRLPLLPAFGQGEAYVNIVPQDFVTKAAVYLAHLPQSIGKTYHLTDPAPHTAHNIYRMFANLYLHKTPSFTIPLPLAKAALSFETSRRLTGIQKHALSYFTCSSKYEQQNACNDLKKASICCPNLTSYLPVLIQYYEAHRQDGHKHLALL